MKVVLFCGGMGTRLRGPTEDVPKPMVKIGYRPILWHLMMYYAHFGHKEFILCLGYKADKVKEYFLNYDEYVSNDFTISNGGKDIRLERSDIADWKITFVDTGLRTSIGQRLKAVEKYLDGDDYFLANYADGLTDLHLPDLLRFFIDSGKTGCFLCAKPSQTFHVVSLDNDNLIQGIKYVKDTDILINGGFFVFKKTIFRYIRSGDELVEAPFQRLIAEQQLVGYKSANYWCMDTFKDQQELTDMCLEGKAPWEIWRHGSVSAANTFHR